MSNSKYILHPVSAEVAYQWLLEEIPKTEAESFCLTDLVGVYARSQPENANISSGASWPDLKDNIAPFRSAMWLMCTKGLVLPLSLFTSEKDRFSVTKFGEKWLRSRSEYECDPSQQTRFIDLLSRHRALLKEGYFVRSAEAVYSYNSRNYLACCSMCGAAAESITLALAIGKSGHEADTLKCYQRPGGRSSIQTELTKGQPPNITRDLRNFMSLLNEWRDVASHGSAPTVDESEAFQALVLLLRYAKFADKHWDAIAICK